MFPSPRFLPSPPISSHILTTSSGPFSPSSSPPSLSLSSNLDLTSLSLLAASSSSFPIIKNSSNLLRWLNDDTDDAEEGSTSERAVKR